MTGQSSNPLLPCFQQIHKMLFCNQWRSTKTHICLYSVASCTCKTWCIWKSFHSIIVYVSNFAHHLENFAFKKLLWWFSVSIWIAFIWRHNYKHYTTKFFWKKNHNRIKNVHTVPKQNNVVGKVRYQNQEMYLTLPT